jgi:hypothetical protein
MASVLSHRLRRLEAKLRPDGIRYITAAPPVCQTVEEWMEKYTPRSQDGREEALAGDAARRPEQQEIGGRAAE